MNDEVYIKHQYDALTKNATPLGLLDLAAQLKDFANSKLATVGVHVTTEKDGKWESSSDITVRLEEGQKLSEALSFLDEWENVKISEKHTGGWRSLANPLFFFDETPEFRRNANPEDIVQGSTFYAIYVTLTK